MMLIWYNRFLMDDSAALALFDVGLLYFRREKKIMSSQYLSSNSKQRNFQIPNVTINTEFRVLHTVPLPPQSQVM